MKEKPSTNALKMGLVLVGLVALILGFQNCAPSGSSSSASSTQQQATDVPMCGIEGFTYLHKNYFNVFCTSCHAKTGFAFPPFSDQDVAHSYSWTKSMSPAKLWASAINNKFCGDACSLKPSDPLYDQLAEWLENRDSCD